MKTIQTKGRKVQSLIFDDDLYEVAKQYKWRCVNDRGRRRFFAITDDGLVSLKIVLFGVPKSTVLIHKNGNDADFSRDNLEILSRSEYSHKYNSGHMKKSSKYSNVSWDNNLRKWKVRFIKGGKVAYERYFELEEEAGIVSLVKMSELYESNVEGSEELTLEYDL